MTSTQKTPLAKHCFRVLAELDEAVYCRNRCGSLEINATGDINDPEPIIFTVAIDAGRWRSMQRSGMTSGIPRESCRNRCRSLEINATILILLQPSSHKCAEPSGYFRCNNLNQTQRIATSFANTGILRCIVHLRSNDALPDNIIAYGGSETSMACNGSLGDYCNMRSSVAPKKCNKQLDATEKRCLVQQYVRQQVARNDEKAWCNIVTMKSNVTNNLKNHNATNARSI